jgi:hypothetical protein
MLITSNVKATSTRQDATLQGTKLLHRFIRSGVHMPTLHKHRDTCIMILNRGTITHTTEVMSETSSTTTTDDDIETLEEDPAKGAARHVQGVRPRTKPMA